MLKIRTHVTPLSSKPEGASWTHLKLASHARANPHAKVCWIQSKQFPKTLFRDDLFKKTCREVQERNEPRIVRSITPLIVPFAEDLEIYGKIPQAALEIMNN